MPPEIEAPVGTRVFNILRHVVNAKWSVIPPVPPLGGKGGLTFRLHDEMSAPFLGFLAPEVRNLPFF